MRLLTGIFGILLCGRVLYYANDITEAYVALAATPIFIAYGASKGKK